MGVQRREVRLILVIPARSDRTRPVRLSLKPVVAG